jgi:dsDNA-specific endonuclease/ATPase MutS2
VPIDRVKSLLRALFARSSRGERPEGEERREVLDGRENEAAPPAGEEVVRLEQSDTLDLHSFQPKDVPSVVREFIDQALRDGLPRVRIIHGKGIGVQREIVRSILTRDPNVVSFSDAHDGSGWGATVVRLRAR